ncbi:hypothetical protein CEG14_00630 [Bordetella genomosp. 1]|uniref:Uncharacterized protein n=1 Tax=Bordetella genomosp. 1 TaxID=1395607 RepID=A0A261SSF3_9BORD|nr:hypothetical protein [Bordetella genomosp. 1]OZI40308.1 hypothetical protein CEG14_00630 [Bordetella genomosp. 1]
MMNPTSPERIRQDSRLIGQTLLKLAAPRLTVRAIVIAIAVVIWLLAASWLLAFGRSLTFEGLHSLGEQTVSLITRYNPAFWWGVVAVWTLIVFFALRSWLYADMASTRARMLPPAVLAQLRPQLAEESVAVLRWSWGERDEPFTVGDLQRAHRELRHNRVGKLAAVAEQSAILDTPVHDDDAPRRARDADRVRPSGRYVEPHLGPDR